MRFRFPGALLMVLCVAAPTTSYAQTTPNLSGTWALQVDKSDFGPMAVPTKRIDVIEHQEPKLTIKRTIVFPTGETTSTLVYAVDGKPYKNVAGGAEITSTLKWDGPVLVMTSTVASPQGEVGITDRYTLSGDGKTLTLVRTLSAQGQEATQTMVLVKQPQ